MFGPAMVQTHSKRKAIMSGILQSFYQNARSFVVFPTQVEYLVVAGGGGSGNDVSNFAGGGGAGGLIYTSAGPVV